MMPSAISFRDEIKTIRDGTFYHASLIAIVSKQIVAFDESEMRASHNDGLLDLL
jgi:hypothetical protein